jgi:hypothetical protein
MFGFSDKQLQQLYKALKTVVPDFMLKALKGIENEQSK